MSRSSLCNRGHKTYLKKGIPDQSQLRGDCRRSHYSGVPWFTGKPEIQQSGSPAFQKTRKPLIQNASLPVFQKTGILALDINLNEPSIINLLRKRAQKRLYTLREKASEEIEHPQRSKTSAPLSSRILLWVQINKSIIITHHQKYSQSINPLTLPWDTATAVSIRECGFMGNQRTGWPGNFDTGQPHANFKERKFPFLDRTLAHYQPIRVTSAHIRYAIYEILFSPRSGARQGKGNGREATGE